MAKRFLSIKNYDEYQHYKKRNPPWIKLHLSILDDPDFLNLSDASKWHYVGLILLASRHGNDIKPDMKYISNRLGLTESLDLTPRFLKEHVLASSASKTLLTNCEIGDSETETETETETEKSVSTKRPSLLSDEEWFEELKKNPAYRHINFDIEMGKIAAWKTIEKNKNRKITRKFILNWFGNIEPPLTALPAQVSTCQSRVQNGFRLEACGKPSTSTLNDKPICQQHKEEYEQRRQSREANLVSA